MSTHAQTDARALRAGLKHPIIDADGHSAEFHPLMRQWTALTKVSGRPEWANDARFKDLPARSKHQDALAALSWVTEVTGTKIGCWPLAEVPIKSSESPAYIGGRIDRGAPGYGEDNEYVYGELLGMSSAKITSLADEGVI